MGLSYGSHKVMVLLTHIVLVSKLLNSHHLAYVMERRHNAENKQLLIKSESP